MARPFNASRVLNISYQINSFSLLYDLLHCASAAAGLSRATPNDCTGLRQNAGITFVVKRSQLQTTFQLYYKRLYYYRFIERLLLVIIPCIIAPKRSGYMQ